MEIPAAITLTPFDRERFLAGLAADPGVFPLGAAALNELTDTARGHGGNALLAWRDDRLAGYVGWVTHGIAEDGCAYGAPFAAANAAVAGCLLEHLMRAVAAAGAVRLRVGALPPESAKTAAFRAVGAAHVFDFVEFARVVPFAGPWMLPAGLVAVAWGELDWNRLLDCHRRGFAGIPNAPEPDLAILKDDWQSADRAASLVLADAAGVYQAFLLVSGTEMEAVGVCPDWRQRGVAAALYGRAADRLAAAGQRRVTARVASSNQASMGLHRRLGFEEAPARRSVWEIGLSGRALTP